MAGKNIWNHCDHYKLIYAGRTTHVGREIKGNGKFREKTEWKLKKSSVKAADQIIEFPDYPTRKEDN